MAALVDPLECKLDVVEAQQHRATPAMDPGQHGAALGHPDDLPGRGRVQHQGR